MAFPTTFVDIQNAVVNKMRLDGTADLQKVKDWINQGYARVIVETKYLRGGVSASALGAGNQSVSIPTAIVEIDEIAVTSGGVTYDPMKRILLRDLLSLRASQSGATYAPGAPFYYVVQGGSISFFPTASGGEVLTFWGVSLPTALSADADVPVIGEPYVKVLEYYALAEAAEFQRLDDFATWRGMYESELQRWRSFVQRRQSQISPQMRVIGEPITVPHDPSTDLR